MKKIIYSGLVFLLFMTGCAQKQETVINEESAVIEQTELVKEETKAVVDEKMSNSNDFINELALHDAVRAKDFALVKELIEKGISVDTQDKYGYTPLHLASRLDQYDIAQTLISNGANVNNIDTFVDTPLLDSTRNSTNSMSKLLICNGADRYVKDKHKMTPLHNASKNNDLFIAQLIQSEDITLMCQTLSITLDSYDDMSNKICGSIPTGVATKVLVTVSNESNDSVEPYGPYTSSIDGNGYCAQLDKPIKKSNNYIVTAVGTNDAEKDIAIANLNDLRAQEEAPAPTPYITGLYEDLMAEFGPDFEPWNAELDKNGLVFRFKSPADLFNHGSSKLSKNFVNIIDDFFPRYLKVISKYKAEIAETRVEGHTSSVYKTAKTDAQRYAKNKKLSTDRANRVYDYTLKLKDELISENKEWLDANYKAYGMAYDNLILDENGVENEILSRRVEFKINKIVE